MASSSSSSVEALAERYRDNWREKLPERPIDNCSPFFLFAGASTQSLENDRVVQADVLRTRANIEFFQHHQDDLSNSLTQYCNVSGLAYRQGLNEIMAPFLVMEPGDEIQRLVSFHNFFSSYLAPFYFGDFGNLQTMLSLIAGLLVYHAPTLAAVLLLADLDPVVYATPWILTLFASKMELPAACALWDRYIEKNDPSFMLFLCLAMVIKAQEGLLETEFSSLPEVLAGLTPSPEEDAWSFAELLQSQSPPMFKNVVYEMFEEHSAQYGYTSKTPTPAMSPARSVEGSEQRNEDGHALIEPSGGITDSTAISSPSNLKGEPRNLRHTVVPSPSAENENENKDDTTIGRPQGQLMETKKKKYIRSKSMGLELSLPVTISAEEVFKWKPAKGRLVIFDSRERCEFDGPTGRLPQALRVENSSELGAFTKDDPTNTNSPTLHYCIIDPFLAAECAVDVLIPHVSTVEGGYPALHDYALANNYELVDHVKKKCEVCRPAWWGGLQQASQWVKNVTREIDRRSFHKHSPSEDAPTCVKMPLADQLGMWKCNIDAVGKKIYEGRGLVVMSYEYVYLMEIDDEGRRPGDMQRVICGPFNIKDIVRITAQRNKDVGSRLFYFKDDERSAQQTIPGVSTSVSNGSNKDSVSTESKKMMFNYQGRLGFAVRFEEKQADECTELVRTTLRKRRLAEKGEKSEEPKSGACCGIEEKKDTQAPKEAKEE